MKTLAILGCLFLAVSFIPCQAGMLTDSQLAGVYAGDSEDINVVDATASAVVAQSNMAAVSSLYGGVGGTQILNSNTAEVAGLGNSTVALQSNIAAIAGMGGDEPNPQNSITNENLALVENLAVIPQGGVEAESVESVGDDFLGVNPVSAFLSAVALQSNIAAVSGGGNVLGTTITNTNAAQVTNTPGIGN
ncbi:MAG: hypothetical protein AB1481_07880 [Candidatus Omnitrophota bacterium]